MTSKEAIELLTILIAVPGALIAWFVVLDLAINCYRNWKERQ